MTSAPRVALIIAILRQIGWETQECRVKSRLTMHFRIAHELIAIPAAEHLRAIPDDAAKFLVSYAARRTAIGTASSRTYPLSPPPPPRHATAESIHSATLCTIPSGVRPIVCWCNAKCILQTDLHCVAIKILKANCNKRVVHNVHSITRV